MLKGIISTTQNIIITGSIDKTIKFWSYDGNLLKTIKFEGIILSADLSANGKLIAVGLNNGEVVL